MNGTKPLFEQSLGTSNLSRYIHLHKQARQIQKYLITWGWQRPLLASRLQERLLRYGLAVFGSL